MTKHAHNIHEDKILILDFGSQYSQLIARRIRDLGVYCEIHPYTLDAKSIQDFKPKGIILSGGPATVTSTQTPRVPDCVFSMQIPLLGICYGMQCLAAQLGGDVHIAKAHEYGHADLALTTTSPLIDEPTQSVWMSHGDHVTRLPAGFQTLASTNNAPIAAMADLERQYYGVQFHPEVTHTPLGNTLLKRFALDICKCAVLWNPQNIVEDLCAEIKQQVGDAHVILGLSGGVDSSVVAALLQKAIGQQLTCVFVDTGLLRLNEREQVEAMFGEHFGINLITVDAAKPFFNALKGVDEPEAKRKIIGREFVHVFQAEAGKLPQVKWLAQGTIYPDVIESAKTKTGQGKVIKSHHNVGGLPETLHLKLLEPLRELFKDEVRKIGLSLGLPEAMVHRHPFPGPGLGVRILGEVKAEFAEILKQADAIFIEELYKNNLYDKVSQAFAVFLPVKAVGVTGDSRRYEYVISLRAVETIDFMSANWANLPHDFLAHVSSRIINEVSHVARVTYDISNKPPATIEWE